MRLSRLMIGTPRSKSARSDDEAEEVAEETSLVDESVVPVQKEACTPCTDKEEQSVPSESTEDSEATGFEAGDEVLVVETFTSESHTLMKGCFGVVGEVSEVGDADIDFFIEGRSGKQFAEWVKKDDLCRLRKVTSSESDKDFTSDRESCSPCERCIEDNELSESESIESLPEQQEESPAEKRKRGKAALLRARILYEEIVKERKEQAPEPVPLDDDWQHGGSRSQTSSEKVRRGVMVRLRGLESHPHMNGMIGLVLYPGKEDRWAVHLDNEPAGCFRNVREQNLEFVCCGGAAQPTAPHPQQSCIPELGSPACTAPDAPTQGSPSVPGKRKLMFQDVDEDKDADENEEMSLAEQLAELERETLGYEKRSPSKRRVLRKDSDDCDAKQGADALVQDILEVPQSKILRRLLAASTDDLAQVVSPEAAAYVVIARSFRTRGSGA